MERFAKIVNGLQQLTISAKSSTSDTWQGPEYALKINLTGFAGQFRYTIRQNSSIQKNLKAKLTIEI